MRLLDPCKGLQQLLVAFPRLEASEIQEHRRIGWNAPADGNALRGAPVRRRHVHSVGHDVARRSRRDRMEGGTLAFRQRDQPRRSRHDPPLEESNVQLLLELSPAEAEWNQVSALMIEE